jgi:hypothetical protein
MLRQEAKLHEMQEEVRRREARGPAPINSPNGPYYPHPPAQHPANIPHSRSHPQVSGTAVCRLDAAGSYSSFLLFSFKPCTARPYITIYHESKIKIEHIYFE